MQEVQKTEKRKDTRGRVLRTGESQRPDGSYQFRWSEGGERRTAAEPSLTVAPEVSEAGTSSAGASSAAIDLPAGSGV